MSLARTHAALLLAALAGTAAVLAIHTQIHAQAQSTPPIATPPPAQVPQPPIRPQPTPAPAPSRAVIFLDPAHGGPETGASLGNNIAEKDVTLAFAQRLRPALASAGFSVVTTRDSDLGTPLPTDQRAETANRAHALACIVIHATASGSGVHIFTSPLPPDNSSDNSDSASSPSDTTIPFTPIPWESAQASFIDQSRRLSDLLKAALSKTGLPVLTSAAPLRPLDNLMCPAVAIEIAPHIAADGSTASANDAAWQQQIASGLASALQLWRDQNTSQPGGAQ